KGLVMYTAAMAEVAKANDVMFVDLFHATKQLAFLAPRPMTIDGVHLNSEGNHVIARLIDKAMFGGAPQPKVDADRLEKIRQAVLDRNLYWFNRYRTVDGYTIYGGRSH